MPKKANATRVITPKQLASACGIRRETIYAWRKSKGFPGGRAGPWDPAKVLEWSKARRRKSADRTPKPTTKSPAGESQKFLPFEVKAAHAALEKLERTGKISPELLSCAMAAIRGVTAKDRLDAAKASQAELTLAKMRNDLVDRSRVHPILVSRCAQIQKHILAVPANVIPFIEGLPQREAMAKLGAALRDALRAFVSRQGLGDFIEDGDR